MTPLTYRKMTRACRRSAAMIMTTARSPGARCCCHFPKAAWACTRPSCRPHPSRDTVANITSGTAKLASTPAITTPNPRTALHRFSDPRRARAAVIAHPTDRLASKGEPAPSPGTSSSWPPRSLRLKTVALAPYDAWMLSRAMKKVFLILSLQEAGNSPRKGGLFPGGHKRDRRRGRTPRAECRRFNHQRHDPARQTLSVRRRRVV